MKTLESWRLLRRYQFKLELEAREAARAAALSHWEALPPEIAADYHEMLALLIPAFTPVEHLECLIAEATERFNDKPYERAWERVHARLTILEGIKLEHAFAAGIRHKNAREDKASSQELAKEKWRAQPDTPTHEIVDTLLDILRMEKGRIYAKRVVHGWIANLAPQEQRKPGRRRKD